MNIIILFGPPAVGKMTMGMELAKITGYKLFHNHMTIELLLPFFEFGSESFLKLTRSFRKQLFEELAKSGEKGLIFTYVWALDQESNHQFIESVVNIFKKEGGNAYFAELRANLEVRLQRNKSELRLSKKESKRDLKASEERLLANEKKHVFNTHNIAFKKENHLVVNTDDISPSEAAEYIKSHFNL